MQAEFMSLQDVGDALGVDVQTVRRWVKAGRLKAFRPGKDYRIRESDLEEFLKAREVRPKAPARPSPEQAERLREIRERYRHYAEALHFYCDDYGGLVKDGTAGRSNAAQFVKTLLTVGQGMGRVYRDELEEIADALGLARHAGEQILSGAPREQVEAEVDARLLEHSQMHAAIQRYFEVGEALADAVGDDEQAQAVRNMSRRFIGAAA